MAAWRQKPWKYKNTAPKCPKKEEWVTGISASRLMQTAGNYIQASSKYVVFNIDGHGGGALGVVPLETRGHISSNLPIMYAHSSFVADFGFSPHDDTLLATTSFDNLVKVWKFPENPKLSAPTDPHSVFPELPKRGDALQWNPLVANLLSLVAGNLLRLYDVSTAEKLFDFDCHDEVIQGASWSLDGSCIMTTAKDRIVRLFDPRSNNSSAVQTCQGHRGVKDSRIVCVNNNHFMTTGYDTSRNREVMVYDLRNLSDSLSTVQIDNSNGTLIPLFDNDTNMLYLAGKGDNNVRFMECSGKMPYVALAACDPLPIQLKGACLIPKQAVDVMKGEVNRMLALSKDSVVPVPYIIPRRSYAEFHADVFPDTYSGQAGSDVTEWLAGEAPKVVKVGLNPAMSGQKSAAVKIDVVKPNAQPTQPVVKSNGEQHSSKPVSKPATSKANYSHAAVSKVTKKVAEPAAQVDTEENATQTTPSRENTPTSKSFHFSVKSAKFRHLKGTPLHKSNRIENVRNLSNSVPGESNGFSLNCHRCAISLKGPAGLISVLELDSTGKLEDTPLPAFSHGVTVSDFKWDPFNDSRLATATDGGAIYLWEVPEGGLTDVLEEATKTIPAHTDKIYSIEFHPLASDVLASAGQDFSVKVWNLDTAEDITLTGHSSPILAMAWSANGVYLATFCKDSVIRIYEPRASLSPIREGKGPVGNRGARLVWVHDDEFIAVSGFDRQSTRLLQLYDSNNLSVGIATVDLDVAPSLLMPHYDPSSHTIFLTARGDTIIQAYEVTKEAPYFQVLSSVHCNGQHQALAFLPIISCDVRNVEFAKAYRLTQSTIEPISFTVPRVKPEFFQDDLFPDTPVTWEPTCNASQWFSGIDTLPSKMNLQPEGMPKLSDAPPAEVKERKYERFDPTTYKTDAQKRDELVNSLTANLELIDGPLPQDLQEGCDSDEWSD
ncbi:coronin-7-like isoform X2 [Watersipora subatra]|uniref:coronin-7-like isoform X2 n=1 Tax=Watersipora subatra TaxID=2589382 RepID=UPI00355C74CF